MEALPTLDRLHDFPYGHGKRCGRDDSAQCPGFEVDRRSVRFRSKYYIRRIVDMASFSCCDSVADGRCGVCLLRTTVRRRAIPVCHAWGSACRGCLGSWHAWLLLLCIELRNLQRYLRKPRHVHGAATLLLHFCVYIATWSRGECGNLLSA